MSGRLISQVSLLALVLWLLPAGTAHSSTGDPPEIGKKYVGKFAPFASTYIETRFIDATTGT
jgi:hypothetical protein